MEKIQSLADFLGVSPDPKVDDPHEHLFDMDLSVEEFCRGVLMSREYRRSVFQRVVLGTLPAAVECRMYDYGYGKPVERVEHTGKDGAPIVTEVRRVVVRAVEEHGTEIVPAVAHKVH